MESRIKHLCAVTLLSLAAACSSNPTQAPSAPAESSGAAEQLAESDSAVSARLVKAGYRPIKRKDQILYCRLEQVTGTNFKSNVCLTEAQVLEQQRMTQDSIDSMNSSRTGKCADPSCGR